MLASAVTTRHLLGRFDIQRRDPARRALVQPGLLARAERYELPPLLGRAAELAQPGASWSARRSRSARRAPRWSSGRPAPARAGCASSSSGASPARREVDWLVARASPLGERVPLGLLRSASAPTGSAPPRRRRPRGRRSAAFAAARQWLEARASVRPVVVALDDVHWADGASLEFLAELRRALDHVPVAILSSFAMATRRGESATATRRRRFPTVDLRIALAPLGDARRAPSRGGWRPSAPDARIDEIVGRAGGNPFFLEELARDLAESSGRARRGELPAAVELVIQARLDRLPRAGRRLAHAASVVGREFDRAVAARRARRRRRRWATTCSTARSAELERRQIIASLAAGGRAPAAARSATSSTTR